MTKRLLKILITAGASLLIVGLLAVGGQAQGVGPEWTTYYGTASVYNGAAMPIGSLVDFYDPDGVHCGRDTVVDIPGPGRYGFISILGDNPDTPEDEGPILGNALTILVNGRPTVPIGPDDVIWDGSKTPGKEVNLTAEGIVAADFSATANQTADPGDIVEYTMAVTNTGNGIDFYSITAGSSSGWIVHHVDGFLYADQDETVYFDVTLVVPPGDYSTIDQLTYQVVSGLDPTVALSGEWLTTVSPTAVEDDEETVLPDGFRLYQNYPNPFNPATTIAYDLPAASSVRLDIFNLLGRQVQSYDLGRLGAGYHTFTFEAGSLGSGVYLYRIKAGYASDIKRMVLLK